MQNKYNKIMIKKDMEKINKNNEMVETLAMTSVVAGGGYHSLSYKRLFRIIENLSDIIPSLRPVIAMNKRNMTGQTCHDDTILISPFNNCNNSGCNGAMILACGCA